MYGRHSGLVKERMMSARTKTRRVLGFDLRCLTGLEHVDAVGKVRIGQDILGVGM